MQKKPFKSVDPHPNFPKHPPFNSPPHEGGKLGGVNFPKMEEEILRFWEENKIFEKSLTRLSTNARGKKAFVFFEGPPTANAAPGIHSVEARAFKDLIPRYQTMRGRYVVRKAGWDTHGLPVELQIEKKLGISGKKQIESLKGTVRESIAYFNKLCKESVWEFKEEWEKLTKRMGFWIDTEHPYITYENSYIEKVWGILKQIWKKGLIYQGHKVVPYCPRCGTALSSHEVAQGYEKIKENSVIVKFKVKTTPTSSPPIRLGRTGGEREGVYILSWTTTPWTLPGNVALAVGENIDYVMVKHGEEYYIYAKTPLTSPLMRGERGGSKPHEGEKEGVIVETFKGSDLVGLEYEPLFDIKGIKGSKGVERAFKIYGADFVNTEEGTGVVHTAVMYGEDDYELGEKVGLPKHHTVDEEGKFTSDLANYGLEGLEVKAKETESKIIEHLKSKNLIFKEEPYEHDYPFCWRCEHYLIYYARNSWFIRMSSLREELIKNNQQINWIPEYIKEGRFGEWLREVKDWAISRERYWGTPLPIWKCSQCKEVMVIGSIAELKKRATTTPLTSPLMRGERGRSWNTLDLHRPYADDIKLKCDKCGGEATRVPEVLDVWFDSGAMPFASGQDQFPADFICEAIDQTRGWFYTLLAIATALGKGIPYKNVISLGLVLDEKGEKMSKSKGNVVNPMEMGSKYGFDTIRWYFYSINQPGDDKLFAEKELVRLQRKVQVILWNIYNYFVTYANEAGWTPSSPSASADASADRPPSPPKGGRGRKGEGVLDKWILAHLQELTNQVTDYLDNYDIFRATRVIESYIHDLSTWYLRRSRGREDKAFFATLHYCLVELSKVIAPFMPYLAEIIYRNLAPKSDTNDTNLHSNVTNSRHSSVIRKLESLSVHLASWPKVQKLTKNQQDLLKQMQAVRELVEQVHALRAKAGIKLRQPLAKLTISREVFARNEVTKQSQGKGIAAPLGKLEARNDELLQILKDEVNVKEIEYGDKFELDTEIDEELKIEGLVRELERQINQFRKESGLKIGERAELRYETSSDIIEKAILAVDKKKTYLDEIKKGATGGKEVVIGGEKVKLSLKLT